MFSDSFNMCHVAFVTDQICNRSPVTLKVLLLSSIDLITVLCKTRLGQLGRSHFSGSLLPGIVPALQFLLHQVQHQPIATSAFHSSQSYKTY